MIQAASIGQSDVKHDYINGMGLRQRTAIGKAVSGKRRIIQALDKVGQGFRYQRVIIDYQYLFSLKCRHIV